MTTPGTAEHADEFSLETWLRLHGVIAAKAVAGSDDVSGSVQVKTLQLNERCLTIHMNVGNRSGVIKAFNPALTQSRQSIDREVSILGALKGTGLVPELMAVSQKNHFFVSGFVAGSTQLKEIDERNVVSVACDLGQWFAEFSNRMPSAEVKSNWFEYLSRYDEVLTKEEREQHREVLSKLPILKQVISKNDAHLSNFIRQSDGRLVGFDFEAAMKKPMGWDILLTARVLAKQFPGQIEEIVTALVEGWGQGTDQIDQAEFRQLVMVFTLATAFKALTQNRSWLQQMIDAYNSSDISGTTKVQSGFLAPFGTENLIPTDPATVTKFKAFLHDLADRSLAEKPPATTHSAQPAPSAELSALCAMCRGKCCNKGTQNNAYLKVQTLAGIMQRRIGIGADEIVDHYLSFLPENHVEGSCLFHGAEGCALPREDRSDTCNAFLCESGKLMQESAEQIARRGGEILIVSHTDGTARRAGVLRDGELCEIDASAFTKDDAG